MLSRRADWRAAVLAFRAAIGLEPALSAAHLGLAHALLADGKPAEACRIFADAFARRSSGRPDLRG
ncbi:hypothetical protein [Lichenicoccus sp.]|uniref:hypothetical protein n=1 Tax=Lichenicoccus sp. TaxID=2781899 RepID=UPI003D09D65A